MIYRGCYIPDEIARLYQKEQDLKELADYCNFNKILEEGNCPLCGQEFSVIDESNPCPHWLVNDKIKKKLLLPQLQNKEVSFFSLYGFLAWLANSDKPLTNIDDTKSDSESRLFETTIKYKIFEWSFCVNESDFLGHKDKKDGILPHYHLSMKRNGYPFISFDDTHILFTKSDIETIIDIKNGDCILDPIFAKGISAYESEDFQEQYFKAIKRADNIETAPTITRFGIVSDFYKLPESEKDRILNKAKELYENTTMPISLAFAQILQDEGLNPTVYYSTRPKDPVEKVHRPKRN